MNLELLVAVEEAVHVALTSERLVHRPAANGAVEVDVPTKAIAAAAIETVIAFLSGQAA